DDPVAGNVAHRALVDGDRVPTCDRRPTPCSIPVTLTVQCFGGVRSSRIGNTLNRPNLSGKLADPPSFRYNAARCGAFPPLFQRLVPRTFSPNRSNGRMCGVAPDPSVEPGCGSRPRGATPGWRPRRR